MSRRGGMMCAQSHRDRPRPLSNWTQQPLRSETMDLSASQSPSTTMDRQTVDDRSGCRSRAWRPDELARVVMAPSLRDYTLVVIDASRSYVPMVYGRGLHLLGLHLDDHHYDLLMCVKGFLVRNYFCPACFRPYDHLGRHRCMGKKGVHCSSCH